MNQDQWAEVDRYIGQSLVKPDEALNTALKRSGEAGLPAISVSPAQGKMLMLLAMIRGAKNILEIGTLGGYSTIWLARGLAPGGKLVTLEFEPKHAKIARANLDKARLKNEVEIMIGAAVDSLAKIHAGKGGP